MKRNRRNATSRSASPPATPPTDILGLLKGGDRRSIGRADEVADLVSKDPTLFPSLIRGLWSDDRLVRMRAADAIEKITRTSQSLIQPYKRELLGLMVEVNEPEVRWHLAAMVPRLWLTATERQRAISSLGRYLEDKSSIVKTSALQALADFARQDPSVRAKAIEILRESLRSGTSAMRARSRTLLLRLALDPLSRFRPQRSSSD